MLYSPSRQGFYHPSISTDIPADAKEISDENYSILLKGQSEGKMISSDSAGSPVLIDHPPAPPLTADEVRQARLSAYRIESDPLKIEAEHDALLSGTGPDYGPWLQKVGEIKDRYPLPD